MSLHKVITHDHWSSDSNLQFLVLDDLSARMKDAVTNVVDLNRK